MGERYVYFIDRFKLGVFLKRGLLGLNLAVTIRLCIKVAETDMMLPSP